MRYQHTKYEFPSFLFCHLLPQVSAAGVDQQQKIILEPKPLLDKSLITNKVKPCISCYVLPMINELPLSFVSGLKVHPFFKLIACPYDLHNERII